jgi:Protein of unknown function (DUF938)
MQYSAIHFTLHTYFEVYEQMQITVTRALLLSSSALSSVLRLQPHRYQQISTRTGIAATSFTTTTNSIELKMSGPNTIGGTKFESPSAERNRDPIWQVLEQKVVVPMLRQLPHPPRILEIAAGAGVHTQYFAKQLLLKYQSEQKAPPSPPPFVWYPTDSDPLCLSSIRAYVTEDPELLASNVVQIPTKTLTVHEQYEIMDKDIKRILDIDEINSNDNLSPKLDLIININMIHVAPWSATIGLMKLADQMLQPSGILFLYGPYKVNGSYCESNR